MGVQTIDHHDRYLELVAICPLRPIRSDEQYQLALQTIAEVMDQAEVGPEEDDYIDLLAELIERYESEKFPIPNASDVDVLRHLIDANGGGQSRVAAELGIAKSTMSEILSGQRRMNRGHIEALAAYFHVSPAVFMRPE